MIAQSGVILAQEDPGIFVWPWYNWVAIAVIIAVIVGYKVWKNKTMS